MVRPVFIWICLCLTPWVTDRTGVGRDRSSTAQRPTGPLAMGVPGPAHRPCSHGGAGQGGMSGAGPSLRVPARSRNPRPNAGSIPLRSERMAQRLNRPTGSVSDGRIDDDGRPCHVSTEATIARRPRVTRLVWQSGPQCATCREGSARLPVLAREETGAHPRKRESPDRAHRPTGPMGEV